jgi:outer membrane protein OmpA-like peptidoglycan-associated protein
MPKVNDRVKETSTSTGTGVFQLGGALTGFAQFSTAFTSGDQVYYCIAGQGTSEWEVGVGTVTSGTPWTLTRNTIFTSSNSNNIVNFSAGTKDVFCTIPAAAVNGASSLRTLTGAYTVVAGDNSQVIECTSGSFSIALTAAATLGVGFNVMVYNSGSGVITIDPNASETIDGATTLTLNQYDCIWLFCNGTSWLALGEPASKVIKGVGAGTQTAGSGTIVFANSNGVTFGMSGSSQITASVAAVPAVGIANSQTTHTTGTVILSGGGGAITIASTTGSKLLFSVPATSSLVAGNNITLSTNGSTVSIIGGGTGAAGVGVSAGTQSGNTGTIVFANSNGVSFGMSGSSQVTASFNQSVQPVALSGSNGSFAFSTATFGNSNGMSFYTTNGSLVGSYTVPTQSVQTQNMVSVNGSTGNISFQNGNNITFGVNASTITASASFNQSVQTQNVHNVTIGGNTAGVGAAISSGTLSLVGGNNITIYQAGNALTISGPNTVAQSVQPVALSGSNGSFAFSTATFGNSNGMSFYTTNGSLVGSYTVPTQSVQTQNMVSVNGSTGNISFQNGNNITFGVNASTITASASFNQSVQTQNVHNVTIAGNTAGVGAVISSGTLSLVGGNNITISQNGNALTISGPNVGGAQTGISGISGGTTQMTSGTAVFGNANNVSFGVNGNTITASASFNQSVQPVALSGSNGSFAFSTATFGNSNGMSFYTTNGSLVGSYTVPTQSVQTQNMVSILGSTGNISFANGNGITFGGNASTVTASTNSLCTLTC